MKEWKIENNTTNCTNKETVKCKTYQCSFYNNTKDIYIKRNDANDFYNIKIKKNIYALKKIVITKKKGSGKNGEININPYYDNMPDEILGNIVKVEEDKEKNTKTTKIIFNKKDLTLSCLDCNIYNLFKTSRYELAVWKYENKLEFVMRDLHSFVSQIIWKLEIYKKDDIHLNIKKIKEWLKDIFVVNQKEFTELKTSIENSIKFLSKLK